MKATGTRTTPERSGEGRACVMRSLPPEVTRDDVVVALVVHDGSEAKVWAEGAVAEDGIFEVRDYPRPPNGPKGPLDRARRLRHRDR